jgi:hypothetical protein
MAPRRLLPTLSLVLVAACLACEVPARPGEGGQAAGREQAAVALEESVDPAVAPASAAISHADVAEFAFAPTSFRAEMSGKTVVVRLVRSGDALTGSVLEGASSRPLTGHVEPTGEVGLRDAAGGVYTGLIGEGGVSGEGPGGTRFWLQPRYRDVPAALALTTSLRLVPFVSHERVAGSSVVVIRPFLLGEGPHLDDVNTGFQEANADADEPVEEGDLLAPANAEEVDVSYEAHALGHGHGTFSIAETSYVYSGGAHGLTGLRCFVADPATGAVLRPRELLDPAKLAALGALVTSRFRSENDGATLTSVGFFEDNLTISAATEICPTEDGVRVTFQSYEVAPYAFGRPSVTLSRAEAASFFRATKAPRWFL